MPALSLVPITAYSRRSSGALVPFPTGPGDYRAVMASDVAGSFQHLTQLAASKGWPKLIVNDVWRSAGAQIQAKVDKPSLAAAVDKSYHQAGRAFDLSITGMQATYPNFNIVAFEKLANVAGFYRPVANTEPWHFDTNDAGRSSSVDNTFGSIHDAIAAVGNLSTQAWQAVASAPAGAVAAGGVGVAVAVGLAIMAFQSRSKS